MNWIHLDIVKKTPMKNRLDSKLLELLTAPTSLVKIRNNAELKEAGELITRFVLANELEKLKCKSKSNVE